MIDRTVLTEALADFDNPPNSSGAWEDDHRMGRSLATLAEAARLVLDFPTIEVVEAATANLGANQARLVLEAVRDTMIGTTDD